MRRCAVLLFCAWFCALVPAVLAEERPLGEPPPGADIVRVGILPTTIFALDVANSTFRLDAYLWFRWRGEGDPSQSFEIINAVEKTRLSKTYNYDEPKIDADGSKYQALRIEGIFHQRFDLSAFPLDRHRLTLLIEDQERTAEELVYLPDLESSRLGDMLKIGSWSILGVSADAFVHDYGTDFGEPGASAEYSAVRFGVEIARPGKYFLWKMLLPIFIVVAAHWGALLLHPRLDPRIALPATALLAMVVLQQSFSGSLPEVGYLMLIDKIFLLAFTLILATGVRTVFTSTRARHHEESGSLPGYYRQTRQTDRLILAAQFAIFVIAIPVLILTA